jgi:hypothetical protein
MIVPGGRDRAVAYLIEKEILRPGTYHTSDGPVVVSRRRMRRWARQFARMRRSSLSVPLPWEHQDDAKPMTKRERLAYERAREARHNAGFLRRMYLAGDGSLWGTLSFGDREQARQAVRNVRYVSPEIEDEFTDGDGKPWRDVITHVALTARPVFQRQRPFGARPPARRMSRVTRLSLEQLMKKRAKAAPAGKKGRKAEPAEARLSKKKRMAEDREEELEEALEDEGEEGGEEEDEEEDEEVQLSEDGDPASPPTSDEELMSEAIGLLRDHNISLPDHTTNETFFRDLIVALHALNEAKGGGDEELSGLEEDDDEAVREEPVGGGAMSLRKRLESLERENSELKAKGFEQRLSRCEREGRVSPAQAAEIRKSVGKKRLSFGSKSDAELIRLEARLEQIEATPKGTFAPGKARLSHGGEGDGARRERGKTPWRGSGEKVTPERAAEAAREILRNSGIRVQD